MQTTILIIGGGISGTALSLQLWARGVPFVLVEKGTVGSASCASSGAILPMTGQRLAETVFWTEALPVAKAFYDGAAQLLGRPVLQETDALFFHRSPEAEELFARRAAERQDRMEAGVRAPQEFFEAPYGTGRVFPAFTLDTPALLREAHQFLRKNGRLLPEHVDYAQLYISNDGVRYGTITAEKIIFCNGAAAYDHPLWMALPWVRNKGEALLVEIPGLPGDTIYKGTLSLCPRQGDGPDLFWAGASYQMEFSDAHPSASYQQSAVARLQDWLKRSFRVASGISGIRPSSVDRKPFAGWHPRQKNAGILNGMGSKGSLHAPWLAAAMCSNLLEGTALPDQTDVLRAERALLR